MTIHFFTVTVCIRLLFLVVVVGGGGGGFTVYFFFFGIITLRSIPVSTVNEQYFGNLITNTIPFCEIKYIKLLESMLLILY